MHILKKVLSFALVLCLVLSLAGTAFAAQEGFNPTSAEEETILAEQPSPEPTESPVPTEEDTAVTPSPIMEDSISNSVEEATVSQQMEQAALLAIQDLVALAGTDGAAAAAALALYPDGDEFEAALKAILDYYYATDTTQLQAFIAAADSRAAIILANYGEAYAQRCAEDELDFMPSEILVVMESGTTEGEAQMMSETLDGTVTSVIDTPLDETVALVQTALDQTVQQAVEEYSAQPGVLYAQPNYRYQLPEPEATMQSATNDSYSYEQWYLDKIDVSGAWNLIDSVGTKPKVRVAVLDGAGDITHADLRQNVNTSLCRDTSYGIVSAYPTYGFDAHGTHVGGIIAGTANNYLGIAGVASGSNNQVTELMSVNVFKGEYAYTDGIVAGLQWASQSNARVVNLSLGSYYSDSLQQTAINNVVSKGTVVVCAAGNDNTSRSSYPGDYPSTINVIATTDYTNSYSNCKASFSDYGATKDISAPGVNILSTIPNGRYAFMDGTSMASPVVAGVAAMMLYANPSLSPSQVRGILEETATDLYTTGFDIYTGWGNVNAKRAVEASMGTEPLPSVPSTVKASSTTYNSAKVWWSQVADAEGYLLYRSTSKTSGYQSIAKITSGSTVTYTDKTLIPCQTYYYKVVTYKGNQKSASSSYVAVKPTLAAPTSLKAAATGRTSIKISWNKSAGASGYFIYWSDIRSSGFELIGTVGASTASFTDKYLSPSERAYYKVIPYRSISGVRAKGTASKVVTSVTKP